MVIVTFRTIKKDVYKIDLSPEATIEDAKVELSKQIGDSAQTNFKMIFKAKVLSDSTTIGSLNLTDKDFIVIHIQKAPNANPSPQAQPAQQPAAPPAPALPEIQPIPNTQAPPPPAPGIGFPGAPGMGLPGAPGLGVPGMRIPGAPGMGMPNMPPPAQQSGISEGPEFQRGVDSLVELGFERTECEAALRAAFGNTDRAAEYLFAGEIPNVEPQEQGLSQEVVFRLLTMMLMVNPNSLENIIELFESADQSIRANPEVFLQTLNLPLDRFNLEAIRNHTAQPLSQQEFISLQNNCIQIMASQGLLPIPGAQIPSPAPGAVPGAAPGAAPSAAPTTTPPNLPSTPQAPAASNPQGDQGQPAQPPAAARGQPAGAEQLLAQFTPAEQDDIRSIQQLGNFNLFEVIQIYQACEKNATVTANILLSK